MTFKGIQFYQMVGLIKNIYLYIFVLGCPLSWASGALDPEGSSSPELVTSVKR